MKNLDWFKENYPDVNPVYKDGYLVGFNFPDEKQYLAFLLKRT